MATNLTNMYNYWKQLDFTKIQKDLDIDATELAQKQDESEISRKKLVELSREFKRSTSDELRKVVAPLLKSFQAEIDSLSRRSKNAEASFLSIYKKIVEMPDPTSVLEYAQQLQKKTHRMQDLEVENRHLRDRLDEYNSEFADVKNQEVTIKQLKEKIRDYEEKMDSTLQMKLKEKEVQLEKQFSDKEKLMQDARMSLAKQLGEAELRANTLQIAMDSMQSELFDMKARHDETLTAKSDEIELLIIDLDRANERAMAAEKALEEVSHSNQSDPLRLRQSVEFDAKLRDSDQIYDILKRSSLEVELAAKEKEVVQLVEDVQRLQQQVGKMRDAGSTQIQRLEEEVASKNKTLQLLEQKLHQQTDYFEIKHELSILKSLEFPSESDDQQSAPKSLETLLLEKNRNLISENTQLKLNFTEFSNKHNKLVEDYNEVSSLSQEQKMLIKQLEDDLRSVNALSAMFRGDAEGEDVTPTNQSSEIVASLMKETVIPSNFNSTLLKSAADGLLPIVQSQRERFRMRAQELESLSISQQHQVQLLQNEIDKLRSDNVKLYEKIKFLQGYQNKNVSMLPDDTDNRYASQYDQRLDPFTTFSRKEKLKRYVDLKPYDKITLGIGRFIMGSKAARTFAFFYTLLLHVFVFIVLYKFAYISSCQRDNYAEDWHKKFADHMENVHKKS